MSQVIEQIKTGLSYRYSTQQGAATSYLAELPAQGDSAQLTRFGNIVLCWVFPIAYVICAILVLSLEAKLEGEGNLEIDMIAPKLILFTDAFSPIGGFGSHLLSQGFQKAKGHSNWRISF